MRDEFPQPVKDLLAKRVGYRCSNPRCRQLTSGPQEDPKKAINVGVASHITAASPGGPRYSKSMTQELRQSPENGIWLCQKCGKLVDNDAILYTIEKLLEWKQTAELAAHEEIEGPVNHNQNCLLQHNKFAKLEKLMPNLFKEMRIDINKFPLRREFVLLKKSWGYWARGEELIYYFDDHEELRSKIRILENHNLVSDITFNNVERFLMAEELVDYLLRAEPNFV